MRKILYRSWLVDHLSSFSWLYRYCGTLLWLILPLLQAVANGMSRRCQRWPSHQPLFKHNLRLLIQLQLQVQSRTGSPSPHRCREGAITRRHHHSFFSQYYHSNLDQHQQYNQTNSLHSSRNKHINPHLRLPILRRHHRRPRRRNHRRSPSHSPPIRHSPPLPRKEENQTSPQRQPIHQGPNERRPHPSAAISHQSRTHSIIPSFYLPTYSVQSGTRPAALLRDAGSERATVGAAVTL